VQRRTFGQDALEKPCACNPEISIARKQSPGNRGRDCDTDLTAPEESPAEPLRAFPLLPRFPRARKSENSNGTRSSWQCRERSGHFVAFDPSGGWHSLCGPGGKT